MMVSGLAMMILTWTLMMGPTEAADSHRFKFPNFQNRPHLNLNGDSMSQVGEIVLAKAEKNQVGAVWYDKPVDVTNGFFTTFTFSITEVDNEGGEGFAFVLQSAGPYAIGEGGCGIGYSKLGKGLALEFDSVSKDENYDAAKAHLAIHSGLFEKGLDSKELQGDPVSFKKDIPTLTTYDSDRSKPPRTITVQYDPEKGAISVKASHRTKEGTFKVIDLIDNAQVGSIQGKYYVGFTAATGSSSFARFAISSWYFTCRGDGDDKDKDSPCSDGFTGYDCAVTNEVAQQECPRLSACNLCVEDVYNCAWCATSSGGKCVVGTQENVRECSSIALEPLACSAGLSRIWLYMLGLALVVIFVFGFLLYKLLPVVQSFRAISLLVALVGGGLSGMFISFVISISLVEISETPVFAVAYGLFFAVQFVLIAAHIIKVEVPARGWVNGHVILLIVCDVLVFLSSISCFILDKRFVHWLPEGPKVLFYTILGATLNFCLVFSLAEMWTEVSARCETTKQYERNIQSSYNNDKPPRQSIISSQARIVLLAAASILSGMFFGMMFGTLRIEEESQYRVALALQQEAAYTYPVGAVIGGMSAMLYQMLQLPHTSDDEIDRIIRHGGDDL